MRTQQKLLSEVILSDEQLKAIGCLVVEVTHLEMYVDGMINRLVGENVATLLTKNKMLGSKLDDLRTLLIPKLKAKKHKAEFEEIFARIRSDLSLRNIVVHGSWDGEALPLHVLLDPNYRQTTSTAKKKGSKSVVKASDVTRLALSFANHQNSLVDFWFEAYLTRRASRRKSQK